MKKQKTTDKITDKTTAKITEIKPSITSSTNVARSPKAKRVTRSAATINEVAELAGVSSMTVSRTVRNPDVVAEKTRIAVQKAIDQLNYIPDLSAIDMSTRKGNTVAVILPSLSFEGHVRTVDGLSFELRKEGFHLLLSENFYSQSEEIRVLRSILGRRPAGIVIINSAHSDSGRELVSKSGVPVIETWDLPKTAIDSVVGFSHTRVGFQMTEHLLACGYRRLAFIGAPPAEDRRAHDRHQGFVQCLSQYNMEHHRHVILHEQPVSVSAGKTAITKLLEQFPDADAVITLTDRVAMGAIMECRRRSISVPDDLAIAGHGGFDFSEHLVPSLTTTLIDGFEIGVQAARLLLRKESGEVIPAERNRIDVGFDVVARESTLGSAH